MKDLERVIKVVLLLSVAGSITVHADTNCMTRLDTVDVRFDTPASFSHLWHKTISFSSNGGIIITPSESEGSGTLDIQPGLKKVIANGASYNCARGAMATDGNNTCLDLISGCIQDLAKFRTRGFYDNSAVEFSGRRLKSLTPADLANIDCATSRLSAFLNQINIPNHIGSTPVVDESATTSTPPPQH